MNMNIVNTSPLLSTDNTRYKSSDSGNHAVFSQLFQDSKRTVANGNRSSTKENVDLKLEQCISGQATDGIFRAKVMASDNEKNVDDKNDENTVAFFAALVISSDLRMMHENLLNKLHQSDRLLTAAIRDQSFHFTGAVSKKPAGDFQRSTINKKGEIIDSMAHTLSKLRSATDKYRQSSQVEVSQQIAAPSVNQDIQSVMPTASYLNTPMLTAVTPTSMIPVAVGSAEWLSSLTERIIFFKRNEIQEAEIRLHPEEFGSLHIQLAMQDGKMHLNVVAMHSMVKSIFELALPRLRTSLTEQGIALQNVNVSDLSNSVCHVDDSSLFHQSSHPDSKYLAFLADENDELVNTKTILLSSAQSGMSVFV